jgi:hypothetical protein
VLLSSPHAAQPIISKLRSAGVDACRYMLDHPLVMMGDLAYETGPQATRIAAIVRVAPSFRVRTPPARAAVDAIRGGARQVWGRDDDGGGLAFKQQDIDKIVFVADPRGPGAFLHPLTEQSGRVILNLSVSETNKELLLKSEGFIPLLVDSLLLHPEHPRRAQVRKMPSWPRSWANFSLLQLYSRRNAWVNLHLLGQPNTPLAPAELRRHRAGGAAGASPQSAPHLVRPVRAAPGI